MGQAPLFVLTPVSRQKCRAVNCGVAVRQPVRLREEQHHDGRVQLNPPRFRGVVRPARDRRLVEPRGAASRRSPPGMAQVTGAAAERANEPPPALLKILSDNIDALKKARDRAEQAVSHRD
jgi:hypothetical protein